MGATLELERYSVGAFAHPSSGRVPSPFTRSYRGRVGVLAAAPAICMLLCAAAQAQDSETSLPSGTAPEPATLDVRSDHSQERTASTEAMEPSRSVAPPKAVVIVVGDPDDSLRDVARSLDEALAELPQLIVPTDAGLRLALRGEPDPIVDDGLGRVRSLRRSVGVSPADDVRALQQLGRLVGADVVVVVKRDQGEARVEVMDVAEGRFFQDRPSIGETPIFVARAARGARRRARASASGAAETQRNAAEPSPAAARPRDLAPVDPVAPIAPIAPIAPEEPDGAPPVRTWFRKNWAYLVAGALLGGVIVGFAIRATRDEPLPGAVIVFRPGE